MELSGLDASAVLAVAEAALFRRRQAEVDDLLVLSQWAGLHGEEPGDTGLFRDRLLAVGGDGTPPVQEFCIGEMAVARRVHTFACQNAIADVLDLQHRLPQTWALVLELEAEVWVARRVATMTRALPRERVGLVDAAVARSIVGQAPSRVFTIAQAKIIEADPTAHAKRVDDERTRRYVSLSRCDEVGLRHIIARVSVGDAIWIDAMVDRVADVLAARNEHATRDELRAEALGWLARPAELLTLLLEHGDPDELDTSRTTATPSETLVALKTVDPAKLRPAAVIYLHLHQAVVEGSASGVARVESQGPLLTSQLAGLLGSAQVTVKPVIDLHDQISVNAYEHPEALKERVVLTAIGDYFPHASALFGARHTCDFDHVTAYDADGPPGQTGSHNSGPLSRRHHRAKTHGGFSSRQLGPGTYAWRTPHGQHRLVDQRGTHWLPRVLGDDLWSEDPLDRALARLMLLHGISPSSP